MEISPKMYVYTHTHTYMYIGICLNIYRHTWFFPQRKGFLEFRMTKNWAGSKSTTVLNNSWSQMYVIVNNEKETAVNIDLSCWLTRKLTLRIQK